MKPAFTLRRFYFFKLEDLKEVYIYEKSNLGDGFSFNSRH